MDASPQELGGPERVQRAIEAMERYGGTVPGFRRAHGRGIVCRGYFTATAEVAALTTAEHMQGDRIETVVRLSNSASSPYAGDRKTVLGLGVRFELPSGGHASWAALTIDRAPFRVPDDFIALQSATRRGRNGKPNPLRLAAHVATHVKSVPGMLAALRHPSSQSFAHGLFNGLNAYFLVDAEGRRRAFRYRWIPSEDGSALTSEQERTYPPQYLLSELRNRLAKAPVTWALVFQMAEPGDVTDDVTKVWPRERRQITAGRLVVERPHEDQELADDLVFDPTKVPPGIELSDDPILHFRSAAYSESHRRRAAESRPSVRPE
ncbi:MAG: catalase family peroxidase [Actinobacteria bacterium]|nr:catalase family peroxidase [Actinomycetota bacterium]